MCAYACVYIKASSTWNERYKSVVNEWIENCGTYECTKYQQTEWCVAHTIVQH